MNGALRRVRRWWRRLNEDRVVAEIRRKNVRPHSHVDPTTQVLGWKNVRIGHHTIVSEQTWLNVNARGGDEPAIVIGDNCFLGRRNFLSSGKHIRIGDYCLTGVDCHFLGSDHLHHTPLTPYVATGTTLDGVIEIGPNCWLGASVTVLKDVRVGFGSIIGAGAVVTRDVPPWSTAVGNPARVLRRFHAKRNEWIPLAEWDAEAESLVPTEADYLEGLRRSHPNVKLPRLASGSSQGDI